MKGKFCPALGAGGRRFKSYRPDQLVEEVPERRKVLLSSGNVETLRLTEILPDILERDSGEIKAPALAPRQELPHGMKVSRAGCFHCDLS